MNELTAAEFLRTRRQWLGVRKVWNPAMRGWDLVVVLDGHYFSEDDADEMAEHYRDELARALRTEGITASDPGETYDYSRTVV